MSISSDNIKLLHSYCLFDKCSRNSHGGAIYFDCQSSIVQYRFCTTNTFITSGNGFHSHTNLKNNNIDRQNAIIDCSISLCSQTSCNNLVYLNYGNCGIFSSNITKNSVYYHSGFYIVNTKGLTKINFSTFEENYAKEWMCLYHQSSSEGNFEDYMCNIVKNTQDSSIHGTIYTQDEVIVRNCTIFGPYGNGKPFSKYGHLVVINCRVDDITYYNNGGTGTFSSSGIIFDKSQLILHHLSTYNCHAYNPIENKSKNVNKNGLTCLCDPQYSYISRLYYNSILVFCDL